MGSKDSKSIPKKLAITWYAMRYLLGVAVGPTVGIYLCFFGVGKWATIGAGLIVYSVLLLSLPFLFLLTAFPPKWAPPGGLIRLLPVMACLMAPFFVVSYLRATFTNPNLGIYFFVLSPIVLLGLVLLGIWTRDFWNNVQKDL